MKQPNNIKKHKKTSHHRHSHKKKWSKKKKIIVGILIGIAALLLISVATFFIMRYIGKKSLTDYKNLNLTLPEYVDYEDGGNVIYYKGHKYIFNRDLATFLFMGIDNTELKKNAKMGRAGQADAIYLFTYDTVTYQMKVLCLNRDTMCDINRYDVDGNFYDTKKTQLCLAYAYGDGTKTSATNQVTAVKRLIYNIPINAYYAIDLSAIKILNDDVGGVTLTPEYSFGKFKKGVTTTIHGDDAEAFVRTRDVSLVDDNLRRMSCQRLYINGFASRIVPATQENYSTPFKLYNDSKKYTVTNIDAPKLSYLATDLAFNYSGMQMITTEGKYRMAKNDKSAQYVLKEQKFFENILDIFYKRAD